MDIYLIRHTQTAAPRGLCYGRSDIGLADSFEEEAAALLQKLPAPTGNHRVYSSASSRCRQLAEKISANVITDDRLLELDFGDWEGLPFDTLDPDALRYWTERFVDSGPPNGESFNDLCRRTGDFWQDLLATGTRQTLIVTHAGVIRALLANLLDLPRANAFRFRIDYGSVHKFQHSQNYTYIHYLNR